METKNVYTWVSHRGFANEGFLIKSDLSQNEKLDEYLEKYLSNPSSIVIKNYHQKDDYRNAVPLSYFLED